MTQSINADSLHDPRRPPTFAEIVADEAEQVKAGAADPCDDTCLCHGGIACVRLAHPHDPDADMGEGAARGNVVPHAGYDPDGQLVQWTCHDPATRVMTAADHAHALAQARIDHTQTLIGSLDPKVWQEFVAAHQNGTDQQAG